MSYTPEYIAKVHSSRAVFLFYRDGGSAVEQSFYPKLGLQRVIHEERSIVGQPFLWQYNAPSLQKTKRKFNFTVTASSISEVYSVQAFWAIRMVNISAGTDGFFLPSFKNDYKVESVAGDNKTITVTDNYNSLWNTGITRHVAIFSGSNYSTVNFSKVNSYNDTQLVLTTAVSGITTSDIIMNIYFGHFESDTFTRKVVSSTQIEMDLTFIEDQANTP